MILARTFCSSVVVAGCLGLFAGCGVSPPQPGNALPQAPAVKPNAEPPEPAVGIPAEQAITPENVSLELIRDIFIAAQMDVTFDREKQFLRLSEGLVLRCTLSQNKEGIHVIAFYSLAKGTPRIGQLELVNRINETYFLPRAGIDKDGDLWFDCFLPLKGGVTKKHVVQTIRWFILLSQQAVTENNASNIIK